MKSLLLLHCYLFLIGYTFAANDGGCTIDGIDDNFYLTAYQLEIDDDQIDKAIVQKGYTGKLTVQSCTGNDNGYFDITSDETDFIIKSTSVFANFDANTPKQTATSVLLTMVCTLTCDLGDSSLVIQITVNDINTHKPEFSQTQYEFKVANPLMPLTDFTVYDSSLSIVTEDLDFSNQEVTYTIDPDEFSISSSVTGTGKKYIAVFSAKSVIQLTSSRTYTITATDSGTNPGPLSNTATIILSVDESLSFDTPAFDSNSYSFNYTADEGTPSLTPLDGPITITTNKISSLTEPKLEGTYASFFSTKLETNTISISVNTLPEITDSFIVLTLSIFTDNTAASTIVVYLEEAVDDIPEFSSHFYTGSYSEVSNDVTLDTEIVIRSIDTPTVTLSGEYSDHFKPIFDKEKKTCDIQLAKDFLPSEIKPLSFLTLEIKATIEDNSDTATLVLSLFEPELKFTKILYSASYQSDDTILVDEGNSIGFTTDVKEVQLTVDSIYSDYFTFTYDTEKKEVAVTVKKPLLNETLKTESEIIITLTASDVYENTAQTILGIFLPAVDIDGPEFSEVYYLGDYSTDDQDTATVTLSKKITISNVDNEDDVTVMLDSYNDNFGITYNSDQSNWELTVKLPLNDDILLKQQEIIIIMTVEENGNSIKDQAPLVISWDEITKEAPEFSELYYLAEYPEDETSNIEFIDSSIDFTNIEDPTDITITLDSYSENFEISYNSGKWSMNIKKQLEESIIKDNTELLIILTAAEVDNENNGQSVLVLELPIVNEITPEFSEAYYIADYSENETDIEFKTPITFSNIDEVNTVEISLDNYEDYFEIIYDDDSGWYIHIKKNLEDSVITDNNELVMTLLATKSGKIGESALVLNLPKDSSTNIEFKDAYYIAQYPASGIGPIEFENPITFVNVNDIKDITISLDNYSENFEVLYETDRWYIIIISRLSKTTLNENTELIMTLIANEAEDKPTAQTALVLELPSFKDIRIPKFSSAYYLASYPETDVDTIEFENPIEFLNVNDLSTVKITLDNYADNFDILYDSNRWYIKVKVSLDDKTLTENSEVVITLIATSTDTEGEGKAAFVLDLPRKSNETNFEFSEAYYTAEYPESDDDIIEFNTPIEFLNVDNLDSVIISLDDYTTNFEIFYNENLWHIAVKTPLSDTILNENTDIVMTLTASVIGEDHTAQSAFILNLPTKNSNALEFSEAFYLAEYPKSGEGTIEFEHPITFLDDVDSSTIEITLDNYQSNFEIVYSSDHWSINIKDQLEDTIINQNAELVMTLIATENGDTYKAESALVLKLPTATTEEAPIFSAAYYIAQYPKDEAVTIELEDPIEFENVDDITTVTITLDSYLDNFEIIYENDKWHIKIKKNLENTVLTKNSELVMTLIASESGNLNKGYSALVLELPSSNNQTAPIFLEAYYIAEYPENEADVIEFDNNIEFINVNDDATVKITLDNYAENFEIVYANSKWSIQVKKRLEDDILMNNAELVMTLTATEEDNPNEGTSAFVLNLPLLTNESAPKFSEAYYIADYPEDNADTIEFENPISFTNIKDPKTLTISLDSYSENFEIKYDEDRWYISIVKELENILVENNELVITLTALEEGNSHDGESVLILRLPSTTESAPEFSEAYYIASYPESGTGTINFENDITFSNVDDLTNLKISVDKYYENFEIKYENNKWYIGIIKSLENTVLTKNAELVMTLIAIEGNNDDNEGDAALVLKLPSITNETGPEFSKAYYLADYPEENTDTIEFEDPLSFTNIDDPNDVTISLDSYSENFEIDYNDDKWYIKVVKSLDTNTLTNNAELVITLTASETDNPNKGESVLVVRLPTASNKEAPEFSEAYYIANYPEEDDTKVIEFEKPISFKNIEDQADLTINLDNYNDYFEIKYEKDRWYINVKKNLDDAILNENEELVMTLIAIEGNNDDNDNEGDAALVLKLPSITNETGPEFSKAYYLADYPEENTDTIEFEDPLSFTNIDDANDVTISLDSYSENFEIDYNDDKWFIKVVKSLDTNTLTNNAELVITLTASETDNPNKGESVLVLRLPSSSNKEAPEFSQAYYIANYPDDGSTVIEFEKPISFKNIEDQTDLTINLDNYYDYFEIKYENDRWYINVKKNLEEATLTKNAELVMTLIAIEGSNSHEGQSALVLKLPSLSTEDAPKFSEAYYEANYEDNGAEIEFENAISFTNIDDPTEITINLDSYSENFEIKYSVKGWYINIKKNLDSTILHNNYELVMTLTATKSGSKMEDQAALILNLPITGNKTAPEFSETYYIAKYPENGDISIEFENPITFLNIDDPESLSLSLDEYSSNFEIVYDSKWYIKIKENLEQSVLNENVELVMTLIAKEEDNANEGKSALVLKLPTLTNETAPEFSEAYYIAEYPEGDVTVIEFDEPVEFLNIKDPKTISITVDEFENNFDIVYESDKWHISVTKPLDESIINKYAEVVMTLTATEDNNSNKGYSALVIKLPTLTNQTAPKFSDAYYVAEYSKESIIEFENHIEFVNIDDQKTISITLDDYSENFEVLYDENRWYINVKDSLDESILNKNAELVMTLIATEENNKNIGESALVLKLPVLTKQTAPKFSEAYYIANYPENENDVIEFDTPLDFVNIEDPTTISISLDDYSNYFDIIYNLNKWHIKVKKYLEDSTINENAELVMTLTATEVDNVYTGVSALVLKLPVSANETAPKFSETYYIAKYPKNGEDDIEFQNDLSIVNVDDPSTIKITNDKYSENFDILFNDDRWYITIKKKLEESVIKANKELVMTLEASESENVNKGYSVLVLELPSTSSITAPEFLQAYYLAEYPESNSGTIEFESAVEFLNVDDSTTIEITLDNYNENFDIKLDDSNKWVIDIKKPLTETILNNNVEIVATLIATSTETGETGESALVLNLPTSTIKSAPEFSDAYYLADYPEDDSKIIEFENSITFSNVDDMSSITITLDSFHDNFEIKYESDHWVLNIKTKLEDSVLQENNELVMTLAGSETGNKNVGYSALVLKLPVSKVGPIFSEAYYVANYPQSGTGSLEIEKDIDIENVDDPTKLIINLDKYSEYFQLTYETDTWSVKIKKPLSNDLINENNELVITLTAKDDNKDNEGYSVLIIKLPEDSKIAPLFSRTVYQADYQFNDGKATIMFDEVLNITNKKDLTKISITVEENYQEYFNVEYNSESNSWIVTVLKDLTDETLTNKEDIVIAITATDNDNSLQSKAVIDLNLPSINSEGAPKFSKTYYTGEYLISGKESTVTFDVPLDIINREDLGSISIELDKYAENFEIVYDSSNNEWVMNVNKNLDETILNAKMDIVMSLTASDSEKPDEVGQTALVLKLPIVNDDEAPKFSQIYYSGKYISEDGGSITLDDSEIEIVNKDDMTKLTIIVDDEYKNNFEVSYNNDALEWVINVNSPLSETNLKTGTDLIVTLTVTETDNKHIGQAALVLSLPVEEVKLPPKFSLAHYSAKYTIKNGQGSIDLDDSISIVNKDDLTDISVEVDTYDNNIEVVYDENKKDWYLNVKQALPEDVLNLYSEVILTMTAKETDNNNFGDSTLILTLPSNNDNSSDEVIIFSQVHYSAEYVIQGNIDKVEMTDKIKITSKEDLAGLKVTFENELYANYFAIVPSSDTYEVTVVKSLPTDVIDDEASIVLSIVAELDGSISYATLVINLPQTVIRNSDIDFSETLYSGLYEIVDDKGKLTIGSKIEVETTQEDDVIDYSLSNENGYQKYFNISYSNNIVLVTLLSDLPNSVLATTSFIPLLMTVGITGTTDVSSAVLNIEIDSEDLGNITVISFAEALYRGEYKVTDGTGNLQNVDSILIDTEEPDDNIDVIVSNEYNHYFEASYSAKEVTVSVVNQLTTEILDSHSFISLLLEANVKSTGASSLTVLNINIKYDGENDTSDVEFSTVLYSGEYIFEDGKGTLTSDDIKVITDTSDGDILPSMSNELGFEKYFTMAYSNNKVSIELTQELSKDILETYSFIALTLTLRIKESTHSTSAVLNIEIDYDKDDDDYLSCNVSHLPYIVALSILSVLLVALIAAAFAFYYFKLRSRNYDRMEEEGNGRGQFDRNSRKRSSHLKPNTSLEERRPTQFIFNSVNGEKLDTQESSTDTEKARRKSVAFDENVEKLQLDSVIDEDNVNEKSEVTHI